MVLHKYYRARANEDYEAPDDLQPAIDPVAQHSYIDDDAPYDAQEVDTRNHGCRFAAECVEYQEIDTEVEGRDQEELDQDDRVKEEAGQRHQVGRVGKYLKAD